MGIFYNPPQPPTANNAGTPREPHVPVGTQGTLPPRFSNAVMLAVVLASWPASLEPRLQAPNNTQQKIAPFTLSYGDQPPLVGVSAANRYVRASWPEALEPRLSFPNNRQNAIAPLTLTYGAQPPVVGTAPIVEQTIVAAWPLTLEPRLSTPNSTRVNVAPLTLAYGDQPAPVAALSVMENQTIAAWPEENWAAQSAVRSTAWDVPVVQADVPAARFPYSTILASWPSDLEPRLALQNAKQNSIVTLTLPTGDQPPVGLRPTLTYPPATWNAQSAVESTAWNVVVVDTAVPYVQYPYTSLLANWPAERAQRVERRSATIGLATGDQPAPAAPLSAQEQQIIGSWTQYVVPTQTFPPNAGWNVPTPSFVSAPPLQRAIWSAWEPLWVKPPVPVSVAPLTLTYGQQPPSVSTSALAARLSTSWNVEPVVRQAVVGVAAVQPQVVQFVPFTPTPYGILRTWQDAPLDQRRAVNIAPLTLTYGDQPVYGPARYTILVRSWPLDLEPRLQRPNDQQQKAVVLSLPTGQQVVIGTRPGVLRSTVLNAWPLALEPRLDWPNNVQQKIAPLTLRYGNQPTPVGPLSRQNFSAISAWPKTYWPAQLAFPFSPKGIDVHSDIISLTGRSSSRIVLAARSSRSIVLGGRSSERVSLSAYLKSHPTPTYRSEVVKDGAAYYAPLGDAGPTFVDVIAATNGQGFGNITPSVAGPLAGISAVAFGENTAGIGSRITVDPAAAIQFDGLSTLSQELWFYLEDPVDPASEYVSDPITWSPTGNFSGSYIQLFYVPAAESVTGQAFWSAVAQMNTVRHANVGPFVSTFDDITLEPTVAIQTQRFHHIVVTFDNGTFCMYLNGQLVGTTLFGVGSYSYLLPSPTPPGGFGGVHVGDLVAVPFDSDFWLISFDPAVFRIQDTFNQVVDLECIGRPAGAAPYSTNIVVRHLDGTLFQTLVVNVDGDGVYRLDGFNSGFILGNIISSIPVTEFSYSSPFLGRVGHVAIYPNVLTPTQVVRHFSLGSTIGFIDLSAASASRVSLTGSTS